MVSKEDQPLDLSTKRFPVASTTTVTSTLQLVKLLRKDQEKRNPCLSCGIGFSSAKTLQAHQQYYCTKLKVTTVPCSSIPAETSDCDTVTALATMVTTTPIAVSTADSVGVEPSSSIKMLDPLNPPMHELPEGMMRKDKSSGQHCTYCAFRANTIRGLRSHVTKYHLKEINSAGSGKGHRSRNTSAASSGRPSVIIMPKRPKIDGVTPSVTGVGNQEKKKYCKYCDIYFKYLSTFLAHRKFYCTVRKTSGTEATSCTLEQKCDEK